MMIYRLLLIQVMMMMMMMIDHQKLKNKLILCKYRIFKRKKNLFSVFSKSNTSLSHPRHPTIVSLAKNYRIHYLKILKEINGVPSNQFEKRSLDSPIPMTFKRQRSSLDSNNTLQTLRNRIQHEENEQLYFNDERRM
jgi:hypothetical protein